MSDETYSGEAEIVPVVRGTSRVSFRDAMEAAVALAVREGIAAVGEDMVVVQQRVTIENPKIGEYRVVLAPGR
jgi:flavin-binding protein dodecin